MERSDKKEQLVSCILDLGEILLKAGAEVSRIEDTIIRIGIAYGFRKVDVFTITSSIVLTVRTAENEIITQTRRISGVLTDMNKIEKGNALSRKICQNPMETEELREAIAEIRCQKVYPEAVMLFAYGLISASFSVFFGGSALDGAASFVIGILLRVIMRFGQKIHMQNIILTIICSAFVGFFAKLFGYALTGASVDMIVIGNIMLLIPGIALVTSLRDMIYGDTISGLLGMAEALLRAAAIAIGFGLVLFRIP